MPEHAAPFRVPPGSRDERVLEVPVVLHVPLAGVLSPRIGGGVTLIPLRFSASDPMGLRPSIRRMPRQGLTVAVGGESGTSSAPRPAWSRPSHRLSARRILWVMGERPPH
jgi:hypothetical protein